MFHNPVYGPRIVPYLQPRLPSDVIPLAQDAHNRSHVGFRVTQKFNPATDAYFPGKPHLAIDIANYQCGESVLAMMRGVCTILRDPNGAIGVRITHPNGWKTEYWHLSRVNIKSGQFVYRGRRIGWVGSTGLDIGGCHLHLVAIDPQGRYRDIWYLLYQNL